MRLCLLIAFGALCAYGQTNGNDGLVLNATITGLKVASECSGTEGRILIQAELYMQFRNDGDQPVIVFKPHNAWPNVFDGEVGTTRVMFLRSLPSTTDKKSETIQVKEVRTDDCRQSSYDYSRYRDDRLLSFIQRLDVPTPSTAFCLVIEPQAYYEFREVIMLDTGYEIDVKVGKSLKEVRPRSEYPALRIQYHLSLKKTGKGEALLKNLQSRWRSFGNLVLDGSGDFTVTSEPIINKSPE
jgi:hypothetical protein